MTCIYYSPMGFCFLLNQCKCKINNPSGESSQDNESL
jgi:hypothetical protein